MTTGNAADMSGCCCDKVGLLDTLQFPLVSKLVFFAIATALNKFCSFGRILITILIRAFYFRLYHIGGIFVDFMLTLGDFGGGVFFFFCFFFAVACCAFLAGFWVGLDIVLFIAYGDGSLPIVIISAGKGSADNLSAQVKFMQVFNPDAGGLIVIGG